MQWRSVYCKEINLTGTFGLFGALKCTNEWDIKPIFSSPRLHLIRPKSLDDYFSKKQYQGDARKTKCAFVSEIYRPGFADTLTGYIVAITLGKVIFLITLSCYNNKLSGWRIKNESGIFKISSILICQRYAINGLFFRNLILVSSWSLRPSLFCIFFSTSSPRAIAVIFFTGILIFSA